MEQNKPDYSKHCHLFPDVYRGDSMCARKIAINRDLSGFKIRIAIINSLNPQVKKMLDENAGINMNHLEDGLVIIPSWPVDLAPGVYKYDVEFTAPSGFVRTWLYGDFKVLNDITK